MTGEQKKRKKLHASAMIGVRDLAVIIRWHAAMDRQIPRTVSSLLGDLVKDLADQLVTQDPTLELEEDYHAGCILKTAGMLPAKVRRELGVSHMIRESFPALMSQERKITESGLRKAAAEAKKGFSKKALERKEKADLERFVEKFKQEYGFDTSAGALKSYDGNEKN